jgi:hypothetical protein
MTVVERALKTIITHPKSIPSFEITQSDFDNTPLLIIDFKHWKDSAKEQSGKIHYSLS